MFTPIDRSRAGERITTNIDLDAVLADFDHAVKCNRAHTPLPVDVAIEFEHGAKATVQLVAMKRDNDHDIIIEAVYHINIADDSAKDTTPYTISTQTNTHLKLYCYRATMFVFAGADADAVYDQMERDLRAICDATTVLDD